MLVEFVFIMLLIKYFTDNNITLTPKGESAFANAIKQYFPDLNFISDNDYVIYGLHFWDLSNEEITDFLKVFSKYVKFNVFS